MIYHRSVTVDFTTREPYTRDNLEGLVADFIHDLGGKVECIISYCDEEGDE